MPTEQALATDYFITIGGGYRPAGNQASLEANVLFFKEVLAEQHRGPRTQAVYFADGTNDEPDLQILRQSSSEQLDAPVFELLERLHSSRHEVDVEYRNHRVPNVSGPNKPASIRAGMALAAQQLRSGDRLLIYVTAHGGEAKGRNKHNTSISCWDGERITASEFETWLDAVPADVPVVMVMAQCYCGGFSHAIFDKANSGLDFSNHLRAGFFAQQHDLAAAGCRPDIENDEEYSSFFWGAFVGRSRNGRPLPSADFDGNGVISFAEAHAHAILNSETIDIPLRTSEALLRIYSRIAGYDHRRDGADSEPEQTYAPNSETDLPFSEDQPGSAEQLASMAGTLEELARGASVDLRATVLGLAKQLDLDVSKNVPVVFMAFEDERDRASRMRRDGWRGRRVRSSGRRELRDAIGERWPELAQRSDWRAADILRTSDQEELLKQISELTGYERFEAYRQQREESMHAMQVSEIRQAKFQRLVNALEAILLTQNLPLVADADTVKRYKAILQIEQSALTNVR